MIMINRGDRVKRTRRLYICKFWISSLSRFVSLAFTLSPLFEMDTFVHGLGRILLDALFSLVFMMVFFLIYMYIQNECVRTRTHYSCDVLYWYEQWEKKKKNRAKGRIRPLHSSLRCCIHICFLMSVKGKSSTDVSSFLSSSWYRLEYMCSLLCDYP